MINFRPARIDDLLVLWSWRNDLLTRENSVDSNEISLESHRKWIEASLASENRKIFMAELDGDLIGTVRIDSQENSPSELSWTVAPPFRQKGLGKRILITFLEKYPGQYSARIKRNNEASAKIAEAAGLQYFSEVGDILFFKNRS